MAYQSGEQHLDRVFRALADPTRRAVLARLGSGAHRVTDLAEPFDMALPTFLRHLGVLEESGLIVTRKSGRVRTCALAPDGLRLAKDWIGGQTRLWSARLDALGDFLNDNRDH